MKILVQLIGEKIDLEDFQDQLRTDEYKLVSWNGGYYLSSDNFDKLKDTGQIVSKAKKIVDMLNGCSNIIYDNHREVRVGNLVKKEDDGKNHYVLVAGRIQARSRAKASIRDVHNNNEIQTNTEMWLGKAEHDSSVALALHFFSDITWINLYKIYEVIKDDVGGRKQLYRLARKKDLNRFTQTAQSQELLGDQARHASKRFGFPHPPMNLQEAKSIICSLFEKWVASKN